MPANSLIISTGNGSALSSSPPTVSEEKASKGGFMSSTKLLVDFAGNTLSAADNFIHGKDQAKGASAAAHSSSDKESKSESSQLAKLLQRPPYSGLQQGARIVQKYKKSNLYQGGQKGKDDQTEALLQFVEDDGSRRWCDDVENWYFSDLSEAQFEKLISAKRQTEEEKHEEKSTSADKQKCAILNPQKPLQTIEFIVMVGFHHKVGSQVEFVHPPLSEDIQGNFSADFLKQIPELALPDGSHATEGGYVNFLLRDNKNTYHCVSCYRQIPASELQQEDSITRTFVQKAVVVLTKVPLYGELRAKLQPTTQALFLQKNFKDTKILVDFYIHANTFGKGRVKDYSEFYTGIDSKPAVLLQNFNILTIIKVMMMEGRIIVYSQTSSKVSNFIYSLIALFPGALSFDFAKNCLNSQAQAQGSIQVLNYLRSLHEYGLPLQLFNSETQLIPLISLTEIDQLDQCKGFLVGATNPLLLNFPKAKADIVINLDTDKLDFPQEKHTKSPQSHLIMLCRQHTSYEKKFLANITKQLDMAESAVQTMKGKPIPKVSNGMMREQEASEMQVFMNLNEGDQSLIRNEFAGYFKRLIEQIAFAKHYIDQIQDVNENKATLERQSQGKPQEEYVEKALQICKESSGVISSAADKERQKKLDKIKKQAVKAIFEQASQHKYFSLKFLIAWMQTSYNFAAWKHSLANQDLWAYSEQAGYVHQARLCLENGEIFKGSLMCGKRQGYGSQTEVINGSAYVYSGDWKDDKKHGQGTLTSQDPMVEYVYDGEWYQGFKQGRGRLITKQEKYSGSWLHDRYHQNGVLVYSDNEGKGGYVYEGDWIMGQKEGMGQQTDAITGDLYIGEFKQNLFHGKGQLKLFSKNSTSSDLYNGDFFKGKRQGKGQLICTSSVDFPFEYDGEWLDDKRHGKGTITLQQKSSQGNPITRSIEGIWVADTFDYQQTAKVTVKETASGKVLSMFEGMVDQRFNPVNV